MGYHRDDTDGHQHQADGEKRDRPQVRPEIAPGGEYGRDVQERRQEEEEHHIGLELDPRQEPHEAQRQPTEDEQDRVGNLDPIGEGRERGDRDEKDEDRLYLRHGQECSYRTDTHLMAQTLASLWPSGHNTVATACSDLYLCITRCNNNVSSSGQTLLAHGAAFQSPLTKSRDQACPGHPEEHAACGQPLPADHRTHHLVEPAGEELESSLSAVLKNHAPLFQELL